jgi:hypothetical protein
VPFIPDADGARGAFVRPWNMEAGGKTRYAAAGAGVEKSLFVQWVERMSV